MSKIIKKILGIVFLFIIIILLIPSGVSAQVQILPTTGTSLDTYEPLSPLPGVIDGCGQTDDSGRPVSTVNCKIPLPSLENYLNDIFVFAVGIASLMAVVQITWGGIQYMTSKGAGSTGEAKGRIWSAIIGLLLLLSITIILNQINPELTKFKLGPNNLQTNNPSTTPTP